MVGLISEQGGLREREDKRTVTESISNAAVMKALLAEPKLLLPIPADEDVERFIVLYKRKYNLELEPIRAEEILGGLMRFLYLTQHLAKNEEIAHATISN